MKRKGAIENLTTDTLTFHVLRFKVPLSHHISLDKAASPAKSDGFPHELHIISCGKENVELLFV